MHSEATQTPLAKMPHRATSNLHVCVAVHG